MRNRDIVFALKMVNRSKPALTAFSGDLRKAAREAQDAARNLGGVSSALDRVGSSSARSGAQVGNAANNMRKALVTIQQQAKQTQLALHSAFAVQPGANLQQGARRQSSESSRQNARTALGSGGAGQIDSLKRGFDEAARSASTLQTALYSIVALTTAGFGVKKIFDTADYYTKLRSQLQLVTKSQGELNAVYERAFDISQNTRTSTAGTIELYARLQKSTRGMGYSASTLLGVTETVNKALATTPGPAGSAEAALLQLSQGMASGTLRGEELNSVMEQAPRLAQMIADGMGIPIGSLKTYAEQGKITTAVIIDAAVKQRKVIDEEFGKIATTAGQGFTVLGNAMVDFIGRADQASGATGNFVTTVRAFADRLKDPALLANAVKAFDLLSAALGGLGSLFMGALNHVELLGAGIAVLAARMLLIPFGAVVTGAVKMGQALISLASGAGLAATGFTALQLSLGVIGVVLAGLAGAYAYFSASNTKAAKTTDDLRTAMREAGDEGDRLAKVLEKAGEAKRNRAIIDTRADLTKLETSLKSAATYMAGMFEAGARDKRDKAFYPAMDAFLASVKAGTPDVQAFVAEVARIGAESNDPAIQKRARDLAAFYDKTKASAEEVARLRKELEALKGVKPDLDMPQAINGTEQVKKFVEQMKKLAEIGGETKATQEALNDVEKATTAYTEATNALGLALVTGAITVAEFEKKMAEVEGRFAKVKDAVNGVTEATKELNKLRAQNQIAGMEDGRAKKLAELKLKYDELAEGIKRSVHDQAGQQQALAQLEQQRAVAIANIDAAYKNGAFAERLRDLENERRLLGLTGEERERETRRIEVENEVRRSGVSDVKALTDAYMAQYDALKKLQDQSNQSFGAGFSNAMKAYVNETKNVTKESEKLWGGVFGKIEDGIVEVVTTGKLNFQNFFQSLAQEFARFASRQLMKSLFGLGDSGNGSGSGWLGDIVKGIGNWFSGSSSSSGSSGISALPSFVTGIFGGNNGSGGGNLVTSAASSTISKVFAPITSDITAAAKAIRTIESGSAAGNYGALGPITSNGDRAYGAYQVMGNNVPSWTAKHYGESLTPGQFLNNQTAQDAVFNGQFGGYMSKYGPTGASQAWFGGEGSVGKLGRTDVLGTSIGGYGGKFDKLYGQYSGGAGSSPLNYTTDMSKYTLDESTIEGLNKQFGDISSSASTVAPNLTNLDTNLTQTAAKVGQSGTELNTGLQQAGTAAQTGGTQVGTAMTTAAATTTTGGVAVGTGLTTTAGTVTAGGAQIGAAMQTAAANIQASGASSGSGGGLFGWIGKAVGAFFSGGNVADSAIDVARNHTGGLAGRARSMMGRVDARVFDNARRFHAGGIPGLKANEEAIIAEKDEALLPTVRLPNGKFGVSAAGIRGGGSGPNIGDVTVNITMEGGSSGNAQQDADQAKRIGKEVKDTFKGLMAEWTQNESRPGGVLAKGI